MRLRFAFFRWSPRRACSRIRPFRPGTELTLSSGGMQGEILQAANVLHGLFAKDSESLKADFFQAIHREIRRRRACRFWKHSTARISVSASEAEWADGGRSLLAECPPSAARRWAAGESGWDAAFPSAATLGDALSPRLSGDRINARGGWSTRAEGPMRRHSRMLFHVFATLLPRDGEGRRGSLGSITSAAPPGHACWGVSAGRIFNLPHVREHLSPLRAAP